MNNLRPFDPSAPLPVGTTVLEASAGTGKTYTIAALATRFLAEGRVTIGHLLLVTFSRAATAELRSRVRERIAHSERVLRTGEPQPEDAVDALLCACPEQERLRRAGRLSDALVNFDAATIMTTHEFCHGMLRGLGVLAPQEPASTLLDDLTGLADEAASDVYLRRYAFDERRPPMPWNDIVRGRTLEEQGARAIAREAVNRQADLVPTDADGAVAQRVAYADEVRSEVAARMRRQHLFSFDDQLRRLRDALADPTWGALARRRLAETFPVVLVDEFQDTDPLQWEILRTAFGEFPADADPDEPRPTLVLIGDPKQAIYAFRGADVHTYSAAARAASTAVTLDRNHRADPHVVQAVGALFDGVELGTDIGVPPVAPALRGRRLVADSDAWSAGMQIRVLETPEAGVSKWTANDRITDDLVAQVSALLSDDPPLHTPAGVGPRASDIAVLVRSNYRGHAIAEALASKGIPATFSGTNSVFASDAAKDWQVLLAALDQPRRPYVQRAILTDFVGGTARDLATATDAQWATWSLWLHSWGRVLRRDGVPALLSAIEHDTGLSRRLLAQPRGERALTDHCHIAELLHEQGPTPAVPIRDRLEWLTDAMAEANPSGERTRRLETDAAAVQIMTIHRAKGLEFGVVFLPEMTTHQKSEDHGAAMVLPSADGQSLDVGGARADGRPQRWQRHLEEEAAEELRALYVGATRAHSHVVTWWVNNWDVAGSPLHRLLQAPHGGLATAPALRYEPRTLPEQGSPLAMDWLAPAGIAAVAVPAASPSAVPSCTVTDPTTLHARTWTRTIDQAWRRTSYSGLTADAHAEAALLPDEPQDEIVVPADRALSAPSPMANLPGGAAFGTLVHSVFESTDARGDGWRATLREDVERATSSWPLPGVGSDALATAMEPAFETPLGPLAEGTTLRSFGHRDRLTEMEFEFALDAPDATLADVAALLARHIPAGHPLAYYPGRLSGPTLTRQRLHGFLTGSIDAVLRLPSGAHLIVDYKTNRLGAPGTDPSALTLGHYTPDAMAEAMMASHYPLQALLYSVALHRFLATRLSGYDPEVHLAGTAYLFVRGMAGPDTPIVDGSPTGVFSWRPPVELVTQLSTLLAGGDR